MVSAESLAAHKALWEERGIEYGLCLCGCSGKTAIANRDDRTGGYIEGEPRKYMRGHRWAHSNDFVGKDGSPMRTCATCSTRYPLEAYHKSPQGRLGKKQNCVACRTKAAMKRRHLRPEIASLTAFKRKSTMLGIPFNLTLDDRVIPDVCPILGIPIKRHLGEAGAKQNSPSLDRHVPNKGYVKGNVSWISRLANTMKNNATWEQLKVFCENAPKFYESRMANAGQQT